MILGNGREQQGVHFLSQCEFARRPFLVLLSPSFTGCVRKSKEIEASSGAHVLACGQLWVIVVLFPFHQLLGSIRSSAPFRDVQNPDYGLALRLCFVRLCYQYHGKTGEIVERTELKTHSNWHLGLHIKQTIKALKHCQPSQPICPDTFRPILNVLVF